MLMMNNQSFNPALGGNSQEGSFPFGTANMGNSNQGVASAMMNPNMQQQMNNANDLESRLQQLQQQLQSGTAANALFGAPAQQQSQQQQQQNPSAAMLQNYLAGQKMQSAQFNNSLQTSLGMGGLSGMRGQNNAMLGSNLLQERLAMSRQAPLPSAQALFDRDLTRKMRGGVIEPFPEKLYRLLIEVEAAGRSDVISFVAQGRAFSIHKPDKFFQEIVPLYFRQSRLSSFKRQLNLYGFELINTGPARGGYFHESFVKGRPELCRKMRRVAVKVSNAKKQDKNKEPKQKEDEPKDSLPPV